VFSEPFGVPPHSKTLYSARVNKRQPSIPAIWIVSDARNDAGLERALRLCGRGLIFRHYHLPPDERRGRFRQLARLASVAVLSGTAKEARQWRAQGCYGPAALLARGPALLRLMTAHSLRDLSKARRARADAVLLSPVFSTRSHASAKTLGPARFRLIAAHSPVLVIALGGMDARRARGLKWERWAAIDAFAKPGDS